jgi:hypothetical protein
MRQLFESFIRVHRMKIGYLRQIPENIVDNGVNYLIMLVNSFFQVVDLWGQLDGTILMVHALYVIIAKQ